MDRRLKQFLAVAETGNVSTAADAMNVSQPTVSVNLRRLEDEYGVPLFTRSSRGVVLTAFGKVLYEHVRIMARLNDHATAELRAMKQNNRPRLKVGCGFAWWQLFVRQAIGEVIADHPDAAVHADICSSYDGLRNLLSGDISCFIGSKVAHLNDAAAFRFQRLFDVEDAFFARRDHPLWGRDIRVRDLAAFPRLDVAPFVNRHFGISDVQPGTGVPSWSAAQNAQLSSNSLTAGVSLLQDTDAFLIYPTLTAEYFARQGIDMLQVTDRPQDRVEIGVYALAEKQDSPLQSAFLDSVVAQSTSIR